VVVGGSRTWKSISYNVTTFGFNTSGLACCRSGESMQKLAVLGEDVIVNNFISKGGSNGVLAISETSNVSSSM